MPRRYRVIWAYRSTGGVSRLHCDVVAYTAEDAVVQAALLARPIDVTLAAVKPFLRLT